MSSAATTSRTWEGRQVPDPGTYVIDKGHSSVEFVARHLMIAKVRGRFTEFEGTIRIGESPLDSSVEVTMQAASVNTGDETRDNHLRSPDFLDVENYPTLTFRSISVEPGRGDTWKVTGHLSLHGVTKPVELEAEFEGFVTSPWGDHRIGFSATGEIDREEWGLTWNQALETGGVVVGRKVRIELAVEASQQS